MSKNMKLYAFTKARISFEGKSFLRTNIPHIMLTILATVLLNISAFSQSYTPVEYNFPGDPDQNRFGLHGENNSADGNRLVYSAANGYGIWAVTSNGHWVLLANRFDDYNYGLTPNGKTSGIIHHGSLDFVDPFENDTSQSLGFIEVKVGANLSGDVRYVWPQTTTDNNTTRRNFIVKGFSEEQYGGSPYLDLSFTGFPKPQSTRNVIKGNGIRIFPVISTGNTRISRASAFDMYNNDWRDCFDIAMDGRYLYITWERVIINGQYEVWYAVSDLRTEQVVVGPVSLGEGRRPTIACNVRNNTGTQTPSPEFDIAYISAIPPANGLGAWTGNEVVRHAAYYNSNIQSNIALTRNYIDPNNMNGTPPPAYTKPMHARMLVASTPGMTQPPKGIYVMADDGDSDQQEANLFFHKIQYPATQLPVGNPKARYVDGVIIQYHPTPLSSGTPFNAYPVRNRSIIGFANPYDGQNNVNYDEFHAVYVVNGISDPSTMADVIHIVRGANIGYTTAGYNAALDSRVILNQTANQNNGNYPWEHDPNNGITDDIESITACVNQMGIHTYWLYEESIVPIGNVIKRSYKRDPRAIDEDIEENTLITGTVTMKNGTSHQGTNNIHIKPGKTVAIWSEPNHNVGGSTGYQQINADYLANNGTNGNISRRGVLTITTTNTILSIGADNPGPGENGGRLLLLPNSEVRLSGTNNKVITNPKSLIDFYGVPTGSAAANTLFTNFNGTGSIILEAKGGHQRGGKILVHGGATLQIPDNITLDLKEGAILEFAYESSVIPPYLSTDPDIQDQGTGLNVNATGRMILNGTFIADKASVLGNLPTEEDYTVISVEDPVISGSSPTVNQFTATETLFRGAECSQCDPIPYYGMRIQWTSPVPTPSAQYRKISIDGCHFEGSGLDITNPTADIIIEHSVFLRNAVSPIRMNWTRSSNSYGSVTIDHNILGAKPTISENPPAAEFTRSGPVPNKIEFNGFKGQRSATFDKIMISNNEFYQNGFGLSQFNDESTAIFLFNTSAQVLGNLIAGNTQFGNDFANGVINICEPGIFSNSFFCSNEVGGCVGVGLLTERWKGHSKLNVIIGCGIGHQSQIDNAGLTGCTITDNWGAGLYIPNPVNTLSLEGIHNSTTDEPGYNTIALNNQLGSDETGQIHINVDEFDNSFDLLLGSTSNNYSIYQTRGNNNLIRTDNAHDVIIFNDKPNGILLTKANVNLWGIASSSGFDPITNLNDLESTHLTNVRITGNFVPSTEEFIVPSSMECGVSYDFGAIAPPRLTESTFDTNECEWLLDRGNRNYYSELYYRSYDTLRLFIERCANANYLKPATIFGRIGASIITIYPPVYDKYDELIEWLKKVLYYNPDPYYYCADVYEIGSTIHHYNRGEKYDLLAMLAVFNHMRENNICQKFLSGDDWDHFYRSKIDWVTNYWRDTVKDSLATPLDTTLPTLEELGLGILRGPQNAVTPSPTAQRRMASVRAERNPFTDEAALKVDLEASTMLRVEVYDVLGKNLYAEAVGYKPKGEHRFTIPAAGWSSGTYYIRLSTPSGEVKTVKVMKE